MSQEPLNIAGGVRTPVSVRSGTTRRTLDEQIFVWFPALYRLLASALERLGPSSRLRRGLISRSIRQGCEAGNRRDYDVLFLRFDPQIGMRFDDSVRGFLPPDLLGVHRGYEGYRQVWEAAVETMSDFRIEHTEVIDFGDRLLASGRQTGHGTASGVHVDQPLFQVFSLRRGLVIAQGDFADREQALEALQDRGGGCDKCHGPDQHEGE